jgi:flagellar motor switch protein FliM
MDLRKGEKSLQVFQILKRIQHTAASALRTHLSQKPREHLHLHAETVPFVLDHDNDLEFR